MITKLLLKILFFLLRKEYYKPLSEVDVDVILSKLATTQGLEKFPDYLSQCSSSARNQFLYNQDKSLLGVIFALVSLRDQIIKKIPRKKKDLTDEEKNVVMKKRGY
jgi:hypothetical protein